jgi:hypothetical protein
MAKKRTKTRGAKMPAVATGTDLKVVRLELTSDVQRQFRVEAAKEGLSMAAMARRLVEKWTAERKVGAK